MKKFINNERGQGIMEYVIISGLVGICCLMAVKKFGNVIEKRIDNMKSFVGQELELKEMRR